MANGWYTLGLNKDLGALIDWDTDTIACAGFRTSAYTVNLVTDEFLSDAGTPVATVDLAGGAIASGAVDFTDFTWASVGAGAAIDALVFYKNTGVAATSPLLLYVDTATGLPVTPTGSNIDFAVNVLGLFSAA
ncbi:MAG: hypothetical protein GY925_16080 [Actinomycetia bacterium]|nr:hypothetical protein [Actinomycetes bacterium]